MDFTEEILKRIYERPPVGETAPYNSGSLQRVEGHIQATVADLKQSDLLAVEADFNSFGCGYASFVRVFCPKKNRQSVRRTSYAGHTWEEVVGLEVDISRHAPIAEIHTSILTATTASGQDGYPQGDWEPEIREVTSKLIAAGYEILSADTLDQLLTFDAKIDTNLGDPPWRVRDVVFYWYD